MDLSQTKLTKQEWQTTEIPVTEQERDILRLLMQGYYDPDIRINTNKSLFSFMKTPSEEREALEQPLFDKFFAPLTGVVSNESRTKTKKPKPIKKADAIRIENMAANIVMNRGHIFEFTLLDLVLQVRTSLRADTHEYACSLYTLLQLRHVAVLHVNRHVWDVVDACIQETKPRMKLMDIVVHAEAYIEKNRLLGKYADLTLFSHQRDLFRLFSQNEEPMPPTLVLYMAPTGTGKTLSPLGLAQDGRVVIFVCSARHVGLGLARAAVSMQKKVAFAYGCASAEDIRLHNYAAVDYVVNRRSGAIAKVDNSNGSKVEIMICDVRSYLVAMHFLLEFHTEDSIVLYWDEPTITMDYETHPLHETIHRNWVENKISKVVLSCATLPQQHELATTLDHFRLHFADHTQRPHVVPIVSFDFKKSISVLNKDGRCVLPHLLFPDLRDLLESAQHFRSNLTLLRYLDLREVSRFIQTVATPNQVAVHFGNDMTKVTMTSLKLYYLHLLEELDEDTWPNLHTFFVQSQQAKFGGGSVGTTNIRKTQSLPDMPPHVHKTGAAGATGATATGAAGGMLTRTTSVCEPFSDLTKSQTTADPFSGIRLTTSDAWTLTDGPTIYIAENVENIGLFYIQQTALPKFETDEILRKIKQNDLLQKRIAQLEHDMEDKKGKDADKEKKAERDTFSREVKELEGHLTAVKAQIESVRVRMDYVPNTQEHLQRFGKSSTLTTPFAPRIVEEDVVRIMALDVETHKKVLLLLGIGLFVLHAPTPYLELMKEFAAQQKLYLILASSDYIYGTNYAFCHGVVSKDLTNMTQQKTIQAMGRIGRNAVQQDYTVRFRTDALIQSLFLPVEGANLEAVNMCRLFSA